MPNRYHIGKGGVTKNQYGIEYEHSPKEVKRLRKHRKTKYDARKPQIVCVDIKK